MAKDPAALLYIDKWLVATTEMQASARAYYMDLILHQFDKGDLPNNIEELATICRVRFSEFDSFKNVFEQVLKHKFEENDNGRLENEFAREIIQKRKLFLDKRSMAGKMSYVIRFAIKNLKVNKNQIQHIKDTIDLDTIDLKNEHMLEQVLKHIVELYINEDENEDIKYNKGINEETVLKEKFDSYKNWMMQESVQERLGMQLGYKPKDVKLAVREFIESCYGDIMEKTNKFKVENYFVNWIKKDGKLIEAINNQMRKQHERIR